MSDEIARDLDEIRARVSALAVDLNDTAAALRDLGERAAASPPPPELLPAREVGRRLAVSESAVYEAIADGRLPCVRFGRAVRVPLDAVEAIQRSATTARPGLRVLERRTAHSLPRRVRHE